MENNTTFHFLNEDFFISEAQDKGMIMAKQLNSLLTHQVYRNDADAAIQHLAWGISCYTHKAFLDQVCAFRELLELSPKEGNEHHEEVKRVLKVQAYFKELSIEEWCLQLYETYFLYCNQGAKYINRILKKGLFQEEICVFTKTKSCQRFCMRERELPENEAQKQLEHLFKDLKMNQVHSRHTKKAFMKKILPNLEQTLSKNTYSYLEYYLRTHQEEWNGHWYVIDTALFAHDLLTHYEKDLNISLQKCSQDEQKMHAEYIFVLSIICLMYGDLTSWSSIEEIPFAQNSKVISSYCMDG